MPRRKSTHVDNPVEVGRRLREARERAGLSQRQLSFPGCSPAYISRIEAGDRIPSLQLLREMGRRLGVSEDYLATGTERHDENAVLVEAEISLRLDEREEAARLYGEALEQATTSDEQAARSPASGSSPIEKESRVRRSPARGGPHRGRVELADHPSWATRWAAPTRRSTNSTLRSASSRARSSRPRTATTRSRPFASESCSRTR
jgi:transcriptional regulator with XRE-family HTH domain